MKIKSKLTKNELEAVKKFFEENKEILIKATDEERKKIIQVRNLIKIREK